MCTYLSGKIIKRTRKRHRCFGCERIIPKGTMADYSVSVDNREISASYLCLDCSEFSQTKEARENSDDGCLWPGSFSECTYSKFPILEPALMKE